MANKYIFTTPGNNKVSVGANNNKYITDISNIDFGNIDISKVDISNITEYNNITINNFSDYVKYLKYLLNFVYKKLNPKSISFNCTDDEFTGDNVVCTLEMNNFDDPSNKTISIRVTDQSGNVVYPTTNLQESSSIDTSEINIRLENNDIKINFKKPNNVDDYNEYIKNTVLTQNPGTLGNTVINVVDNYVEYIGSGIAGADSEWIRNIEISVQSTELTQVVTKTLTKKVTLSGKQLGTNDFKWSFYNNTVRSSDTDKIEVLWKNNASDTYTSSIFLPISSPISSRYFKVVNKTNSSITYDLLLTNNQDSSDKKYFSDQTVNGNSNMVPLYIGTTAPSSIKDPNIIYLNNYDDLSNVISLINNTSFENNDLSYTNTSGSKENIFVLTNSNKSVTFINPEFNSPITQNVDTTTIQGYKIFKTAVGVANNKSVKIRIS